MVRWHNHTVDFGVKLKKNSTEHEVYPAYAIFDIFFIYQQDIYTMPVQTGLDSLPPTPVAKYTEQSDKENLNYVYNWCIITFS